MTEWLALLQELPTALLGLALGLVMLLDTIPLVGILVPGDVAILTAMGVGGPLAAASSLFFVVGGCLVGWSLTFFAGRAFGERLRRGRLGAWIGEARWAAADRAIRGGGPRMLVAAPFLPVLNTLVPLAAGGLRMPYHRFIRFAALGSVLWGALYVGLGMVAKQLSGLLPGESFTMGATIVIGFAFGWIALLGARRQLAGTAAAEEPTQAAVVAIRPASAPQRVIVTAGGRRRRPRRTGSPVVSRPVGGVRAGGSVRPQPTCGRAAVGSIHPGRWPPIGC